MGKSIESEELDTIFDVARINARIKIEELDEAVELSGMVSVSQMLCGINSVNNAADSRRLPRNESGQVSDSW